MKILEDETIVTKTGRTHRYVDRCKGKVPTVDSQLDRGDLQRTDPVEQGSTIPPDSTESSLHSPRENDAGSSRGVWPDEDEAVMPVWFEQQKNFSCIFSLF